MFIAGDVRNEMGFHGYRTCLSSTNLLIAGIKKKIHNVDIVTLFKCNCAPSRMSDLDIDNPFT